MGSGAELSGEVRGPRGQGDPHNVLSCSCLGGNGHRQQVPLALWSWSLVPGLAPGSLLLTGPQDSPVSTTPHPFGLGTVPGLGGPCMVLCLLLPGAAWLLLGQVPGPLWGPWGTGEAVPQARQTQSSKAMAFPACT